MKEEARKRSRRNDGIPDADRKSLPTEVGFEAANLGVQVYGGHGFIAEWGMEQIVRDTRIALLYGRNNRYSGAGPVGS